MATTKKPLSLPIVPEAHMKRFYDLVEDLGLNKEITQADMVSYEKFSLHSQGVTLEEGGKVAIHDRNNGAKHALGENIYQQGIVNLKLKLE